MSSGIYGFDTFVYVHTVCNLGCLYLIQVRVGFQAASPLAWPGRSTRTNAPGDPVFGAGVLNKRRPRRARANCSRSSRKFSNVLLPRKVHTVRSFRVVALRAACQPACKAPAAQQVVVRTSVLWAVRRPSRRLPVRPGGRPQHSKSVRAAALRAACQSARKATKSAASRLRISVPQGCSPPVAPLVSPPRRAPAWRHNVPDCRGYRCVSRKHRTRSVAFAMWTVCPSHSSRCSTISRSGLCVQCDLGALRRSWSRAASSSSYFGMPLKPIPVALRT